MALHITSLNSGSNGNCYYIGNDSGAILVDAGLSCRETEKRLQRLGLSLEKVQAIFVSHEHDDHIKGIPVIVKKYQIPVYITTSTLDHGRITLEEHLVRTFRAYEPISIGDLQITAFPKFHDAADPHSFTISCQSIGNQSTGSQPAADRSAADLAGDRSITTIVGVFTDIGAPCEHLVRHFRQCHAAFLEANYDEDMLDKGSYPYHLKQRIRGGNGHLSNRQALELFLAHRPSYMSHLFLSHLSQNNNDPDLACDLFHAHAGQTKIVLASRYEETALYAIEGCDAASLGAQSVIGASLAQSNLDPDGDTSVEKAPPATQGQRGTGRIRPQTNPLQTSLF